MNEAGETRERILRAAEELFSEKGFDGTSVRAIVSRAQVTNPMLYYYFGSKEELLEEVILTRCSEYERVLKLAMESATCVRDVFAGTTRAALEAARTNPEGMRLVLSFLSNPSLRTLLVRLRAFGLRKQQIMAESISALDNALDGARIRYVVSLFHFVLNGVLLARFPEPGPQIPDSYAIALGETFSEMLHSSSPANPPELMALVAHAGHDEEETP